MRHRQIARLHISAGFGPPPIREAYQLYEMGGLFYIKRVSTEGETRTQKTIQRSAEEVDSWLERLRNATVPAMPVSPEVCDGEYLELRIEGEGSTMTLGWWTLAPEGAELVAEFADWIRDPWSEPSGDTDDETDEA